MDGLSQSSVLADHGSVSFSTALLACLLPGASAWQPVDGGESSASVSYDADRRRYAKVAPREDIAVLKAERDRIEWLSNTAIPCPTVLAWHPVDDAAVLVTREVIGTPADQLTAAQLAHAWPSIADALAQLHCLPVDACPFDRTLAQMMPLARATIAEDRLHTEYLPQHLVEAPPSEILHRLEEGLAVRTAQSSADAVVCHGDFCLPNIVIDPDTLRVSGLIDLGRLGKADPYADISLLLANAPESWPDERAARAADGEFAVRYGITLDSARQDFYLTLDPLTW